MAESEATWRLEYDASPQGDGSRMVVWEKTLEQLLAPNGTEPLLVWMLREADRRGGAVTLERMG